MGAILLFENDQSVYGLIEKIFPNEDMRIFKPPFRKKAAAEEEAEALKASGPVALEETVRQWFRGEVDGLPEGSIHETVIGKVEKVLIGIVLEEEKGNQVRAAKRLGINRNTLRKKMKDLRIITRVISG
jgi:two-component system nitrogen regulation response regulator GlnG